MNLLLDTFAVIGLLRQPDLLLPSALDALLAAENAVWFSPVSVWEIEIKASINKLAPFEGEIDRLLRGQGFSELPIVSRHATAAGRLPLIHKDPFDRLLVAQALSEGFTLVTPDKMLPAYGVRVLSC